MRGFIPCATSVLGRRFVAQTCSLVKLRSEEDTDARVRDSGGPDAGRCASHLRGPYDQDGVQLWASKRLVTRDAATCHVREDRHSDDEYQRLNVNARASRLRRRTSVSSRGSPVCALP